MDITMTVGTRGLALSGSFSAFAGMSGIRGGWGKPAAGHRWPAARRTAPTRVTTVRFRRPAPIGTGVPVLDRMRSSAPEP